MLEINVKASHKEAYDDKKEEFISFDLDHDCKFHLEHSLVSISKWESKWHKPFLSKTQKTEEELLDYIRCMIVTPNVPDNVVYFLSKEDFVKINEYIENPMTATTFHDARKSGTQFGTPSRNRETLTSEIIYYWMIENGIPVEFQKWHLNRLLTLIRVCGIKHNSDNKMNKRDNLNQMRSINQARRAKHGAR